MPKYLTVFVLIALFSAYSTLGAKAYPPWIFTGDCASNGSGGSWRSYLSAKRTKAPTVGVQFRDANSIGDPTALPGIDPSACYFVKYTPGSGFFTLESFAHGRDKLVGRNFDSQPGAPDDFEINVFGLILAFDESGRVYDMRGRPVAVLQCYHTNEACNGFGYKSPLIPRPRPVPPKAPTWEQASQTILADVSSGSGIESFRRTITEQHLRLARLIDWRFEPLADDLERLASEYVTDRDLSILRVLDRKCGEVINYIRKYGVSQAQSFSMLAGLSLAVKSEIYLQTKDDADQAAIGVQARYLKSILKYYRDEVSSQIYARYSEVKQFGPNWSWQLDARIAPMYRDRQEAIDRRMLDMGYRADAAASAALQKVRFLDPLFAKIANLPE